MRLPDGPDYFNEDGIHNPPGYGEAAERGAKPFLIAGIVVALFILATTGFLFTRGEGGSTAESAVSASQPPLPTSKGITQAQLDKLGDSIEARYASGDTEVAEALLDNFMRVHPECVAAVLAGGEGTMRDVQAESAKVAKYLESTAPHPQAYTTVITTRNEGVVKAAVLGVSCDI